jgi:hypothetical protein
MNRKWTLMDMPERPSFLLATILPILVSACGPNIPKANFYHAQHGTVASDDPRLVSVRQSCGKTVYAQGITIDGKVVTDRDIAIKAWTRNLMDQAMPPGAGAIAGTNAALAVSSGNPALATGGAQQASQIQRPSYSDRLNQLENETWACVEKAGWTKQPAS